MEQEITDYISDMVDKLDKIIQYLQTYKEITREQDIARQKLEGKDKEIERLKEENKKYNKWIESLNKDNHRLNNIIKIMGKYFELILDLGYDYDGLNEKESLKKLIDELCRYASLGRAYNTTEIIYVNGDKKYNILNEELKGSEKE